MPSMQTVLSELNKAFSKEGVVKLAERLKEFEAAGKATEGKLGTGFVVKKGTRLYEAWKQYAPQLPGSFHGTIRGIQRYAISTKPPTPIMWAWAPGYDYELTIWQAPDTELTRGGITVLIKSPYPKNTKLLKRSRSRRR